MNKYSPIGLLLLLLTHSCLNQEEAFEALFPVPDFTLENCLGEAVSKDDLLGQIWVVDFIFTRCGGPCPLMTQRMRTLQGRLIEEGLTDPPHSVRLVSISVDPAYDTPEVLYEFATNWKADLTSWHFLTGPPESTLRVIREGFKTAAEREGPADLDLPDIIHSTHFLLVDQRGWVRKIFYLDESNLEERIIEGIRIVSRQ
jgi:protein SCO1/2